MVIQWPQLVWSGQVISCSQLSNIEHAVVCLILFLTHLTHLTHVWPCALMTDDRLGPALVGLLCFGRLAARCTAPEWSGRAKLRYTGVPLFWVSWEQNINRNFPLWTTCFGIDVAWAPTARGRPRRWIVTIPSLDRWLAIVGNRWRPIGSDGCQSPKPS